MGIQIELDAIKLLPSFQDFEALVGERSWLKIVEDLRAEMRGNPYLEHHYLQEHRIAFAFEFLQQQYSIGRHVDPGLHPHIYEACCVVSQFLDLVKSHPGETDAFIGRMRGALKNPSDMRALQFELQVATHLVKQGHHISFPELEKTGTFDILANIEGRDVEFECKYVTNEKGRAVTRHAAVNIAGRLVPIVQELAGSISVGLLLRIVFDGRAPSSQKEIGGLIEPLAHALHNRESVDFDGGRIILIPFGIEQSPFAHGKPNSARELADFLSQHGAVNTENISVVNPSSVVILSLESARPALVLKRVFETASDAAKRQLTGGHAAALCLKFGGASSYELEGIARERDGVSALRMYASRFLNSASSDHVTLLAFFADDAELTVANGSTTRSGAVYSFVNERNAFYATCDLRSVFARQ